MSDDGGFIEVRDPKTGQILSRRSASFASSGESRFTVKRDAASSIGFDDHGTEHSLEQLAVFMMDLRSFWPLLVPLATGWWRRQFETEGEFGGDRWAALSPDYAAVKSVRFPGKGILEATGDMRRAASRPLRAQTPTSLVLSIDDPKLPYHQDGTTNMPRRPLVFGDPLPEQARHELDQVAEHYVTDLLRRI